jgi:competence protein ComEA
MNGRLLFLGGVLGLAALVAAVRYARLPAPGSPPPVLTIAAAGSAGAERRSRAGRSESEARTMVVVYVAGEVVRPGVYRLAASGRAEAALRAAGGATGNADLVAVNLAEPLRDGEEIAVPARGAAEVAARGSSRRKRRARTPRVSKKNAVQSVDLNTADEEQLQTLPGIGLGLAARIVAYRRVNGPFQMLDDVRDVGGMTDGKFDRIAPYLFVP